ncbi:MAG: MATE family efflux transporter [Candidatus Protistobacter heckmanni]|nr:MATE family efflux transporter [Candidatus Protistobacter heckmanni]
MNALSKLEQTRRLTEGPIASTLFFFTLPMLGSNVLQSLNGSINAMWVGHFLGEAALSATASSNTIMFFLIGTIFGVGMAATILVGQAMGARDLDRAKRVVGTSISFFAALSMAVAVLGWIFCPEVLTAMRVPHDALPLAVSYMRIIFLAMPFMFTYIFLTMTLRGAGDSKTPFYFMLLSVGLDIALNPLLLFGWGPVPGMGIAGSATATLIAQCASLVGLVAWLYRSKHFLCLRRGETRYLRIDGAILGALIRKGIPMGLQIMLVSLSMIVIISLANRFGSQTSAAYGACLQLWNYVQMPAMAVGMAVSSMVSQNVGARRWDRVHRVAMTGVTFNFLMTGALAAIIYLFSGPALGLFLPRDVAAFPIAQHINAIVLWSFVLFGVMFVLSGVVRSTGAVVPPLILLFISLWLVRVPFARIGSEHWGADAVWWSFPVGSAVAVVLMSLYYRHGSWKKAHMMAEPPPVAPEPAM